MSGGNKSFVCSGFNMQFLKHIMCHSVLSLQTKLQRWHSSDYSVEFFFSLQYFNPFIHFKELRFKFMSHRVNPFSTVKCKNFRNNVICSAAIHIKYCLHSRPIASGNY